MYFVYILKSLVARKTYVGHTDSMERRFWEHNHGKGGFSKIYKPWQLIHLEKFNTLNEAIKKEKYLKSAAGRRWMKKFIFN